MKKYLLALGLGFVTLAASADIVIYPNAIVKGTCGHASGCPGGYCAYADYYKTAPQGWGWAPISSTNVWTATDTNRSNTKVQVGGDFGDGNCNQTSCPTLNSPPVSPVYRFAVYYTNNVPTSTNQCPLVLRGFNP